MKTGNKQFPLNLLVLVLVFIIGSVGLAILEGLSFVDAIYFIIVTVATVGYGDIVPTTDGGRFLVMVIILAGVGTFLTVVAYIIEQMIARNDLRSRQRKVRMIIGVFFSEVGVPMIQLFKPGAPSFLHNDELLVKDGWDKKQFLAARKSLSGCSCNVDLMKIDRVALGCFLSEKRGFMIQLLQHPMLFDDEPFSDMIAAISHLQEELSARRDLVHLSKNDAAHLSRDCERAYCQLLTGWLEHMEYLKDHYPYLFSLSVRTNPFDPDASAEIE
ncbi:two pore domain potassium channel family protein [Methanocalculus taiwanensis]|uniref:Two pore domain potassium channel family protein n=1 Tax=Methanocalculus taiwanensis TaxID=106207 RepID=A0ABD4TIV3_9EURY|nr:potassium channel family protein [Methanocalculus taiwanensis]MCQ1538104.1 two pore domain potassium channel family protein [Methanocalculus taiwanensis]